MPGENSVTLANLQRKNLPHIASALNLLEPMPILNGLFRFQHKEQAYNLPCSHRYHQIQPITTVNATAFTNTNYFFDFNLPMNIDMIDEEILLFTLLNTGSSSADWVANASVPFWFQRIEIRVDNEIKQTLRDIQLYLENTIYLNDFERQKQEPMIGLDKEQYKVKTDSTLVASGLTKTFRLRLNSFLSKCNINLKAIRGQIVVRVFPQAISAFSDSAVNANIQLQSPMLLVRECELTADGRNKMNMIHRQNVDYRYLDVVHEQAVVNLTSGSTYKYVTNNFHDTIYSHVVVLTRSANPTLAQLETFLEHLNIYLEDVSSASLSNGIQWSSDDLKQIVYQSHFPNAMTQAKDMNVYVPLVASLNPEEANKKGVQNGWDVLPRNSKLCINPKTSGQSQIDIVCYEYKHCRIENGKINLF
jgi:small nuclear ribonucleoprotein (snRNP)-like protein